MTPTHIDLKYGVTITRSGWLRFDVRQGRRWIGQRRTLGGALELGEGACGVVARPQTTTRVRCQRLLRAFLVAVVVVEVLAIAAATVLMFHPVWIP